jgi:sec-independent protein translocase protein TatA
MGGLSIWHWLVVIAVVAVLFGGKGKIAGVMGDFAKGIKAFKSGMKDGETDGESAAQVTPPPIPPKVTATSTVGERATSDRG